MTPNPRPPSAFSSFRILGERAQKLLRKARTPQERSTKNGAGSPFARSRDREELMIRISLRDVVNATFTVIAILLGLWLMQGLTDKIILLLLSFFVAAVIDPGVRTLERLGVPRGLGILVQYFVAACVFMFLVLSLIPIIAEQLTDIARFLTDQLQAFLNNPHIAIPFAPGELNARLTELMRATVANLSIDKLAESLQQWGQDLAAFAQGSLLFATRIAGSVLDFVVRTIIVLVLAFFIQMEKEHLQRWARGFFAKQYRSYIDTKIEAIHVKIGQWARGQLVLGLAIGLLVYVALTILRMPYAVTLAVLAGFTEFIPYIGPFIAAIPAVLIALTQEGIVWALIVAGVYYVVQWCENNLLVPLIMRRAVGLSPIAIIFAMLVGVSFPTIIHPVLGILLAVPVTTMLALFLEDWRGMKR